MGWIPVNWVVHWETIFTRARFSSSRPLSKMLFFGEPDKIVKRRSSSFVLGAAGKMTDDCIWQVVPDVSRSNWEILTLNPGTSYIWQILFWPLVLVLFSSGILQLSCWNPCFPCTLYLFSLPMSLSPVHSVKHLFSLPSLSLYVCIHIYHSLAFFQTHFLCILSISIRVPLIHSKFPSPPPCFSLSHSISLSPPLCLSESHSISLSPLFLS